MVVVPHPSSLATMAQRQHAFFFCVFIFGLISFASAVFIPGRRDGTTAPDDLLLAVRDNCFEVKLEGNTLTAFCLSKSVAPTDVSVDLNQCLENSFGDMLFVEG